MGLIILFREDIKLDSSELKKNSTTADFSEIIKRAYEKGMNENEMTLDQIIKDLKDELKPLLFG